MSGAGTGAAAAAAATPRIITKHFINGQFVDSASGKTFETLNPATGEKLADVAMGEAPEINAAVAAARHAFESTWKFTNGSTRRDLLNRLANLLERDADEIARLETLDNGKPLSESRGDDVAACIDTLRYYAGWADKVEGRVQAVDGNFLSFTKHEPVGVCGQIIPWNFPLLMAVWKCGPALAMGCTIVLKPAEQTPLTALRFAELVQEAGFPPGVFNVVAGFGPGCGSVLVEHPNVDKIAFTGSTEVGKLIMRTAAQVPGNLKRVTLELGGKSAFVVDESADVDHAVATCANAGIFFNQGQVCTASSRVFVHASLYDSFVEKIAAAAQAKRQGNGLDAGVNIGPQVSAEQRDVIMNYIDIGRQEGATVAAGGTRGTGAGYFVAPTVFSDVTDNMRIAKEEIFGPVLCVLKFNTIDEAIERANNGSIYGLAASWFGRDIAGNGMKFANRAKAGTVWLNTYNAGDCRQTFGGFKSSGFGRELGSYSLSNYTEVKSIMLALDHAPIKP